MGWESETTQADDEVQELIKHEDGSQTLVYHYRRIRQDAQGNLISQYIYTTPGRVIYNKAIQEALAS